MARKFIFFQLILSPHILGLAEALARRGHSVTYVAADELDDTRDALGWPKEVWSKGVEVLFIDNAALQPFVSRISEGSVCIFQGFRGNGYVSSVFSALMHQPTVVKMISFEDIDCRGFKGIARQIVYSSWIWMNRYKVDHFLPIGRRAKAVIDRAGIAESNCSEFIYFLNVPEISRRVNASDKFIFIFVGQLIERKNIGTLLQALKFLDDDAVELLVVGDGALRAELSSIASPNVRFLGAVDWKEIGSLLVASDCLVLPSYFDGWGAAASEALLVGTPVIVSTSCGVGAVVGELNLGSLFDPDNVYQLCEKMREAVGGGKITIEERAINRSKAKALRSDAGALYLEEILESKIFHKKINPPWKNVVS